MRIKESSEVAARKALDWGFTNIGKIKPVGMLVEPLSPLPTVSQTAAVTAEVEQAAVSVLATPEPNPTIVSDPVAQKAISQAALKVPATQTQAPPFWLAVIVVIIVGIVLFIWNANRNRDGLSRGRYR